MTVRQTANFDDVSGASAAPTRHAPVRTYWEEVNLSEWSRYLTAVEKRAVLRALEAAGTGGVSLEIGCDGGRWSSMLAERGWSATCTDTRKEALELTKQRLPSARCVLVDPADTTLPGESASIDLLLCIEVEAVSSQQWFIREAARLLRPGGFVVATLLNRSSLRAFVHAARPGNRSKAGALGRYEVTYRKWKTRLLQSGLHPIYEEGFCWAPFHRNSNSRMVRGFVAAERLLRLNHLIAISPWVAVVGQKQ